VDAVADGGQAVDVAAVLGGQDLCLAFKGDSLAGPCARGDHEVGRGRRGRRRPAEVSCRSDRVVMVFFLVAGGPCDISASSMRRLGGLDSKSVLSDLGGCCAVDGWPKAAIQVSI
jgi:hypothetical protein